jgi:predicted metalloendopeptidase
MIDSAKLVNQEEKTEISEEEITRRIDAVLMLEISLAKASAPREERRNATKLYNPSQLKDLGELPGGHGIRYAKHYV